MVFVTLFLIPQQCQNIAKALQHLKGRNPGSHETTDYRAPSSFVALCEIEMYGFLLSARSLSKDMDFNYGVSKASMEANG